ncbi:membrane protein [Nitrospira sp. KM1]|uniref:low affinity iron permease family protein n=1 Tax=Nitrospira sp. KM1 TaxID=1936990 RepID=UPI0013A7A18F|nr:low affinity iron permease family protein [Nitrospira sp. KM1]BCA56039.1 membrane protein [Nitrospira sp. KM1]
MDGGANHTDFERPAQPSDSDHALSFSTIAKRTASAVGHPAAFALACVTIAVWALSGPLFGFSDTWQLVINTGTTIVTFLMVFIIQNSQNRDSCAIQLKLDELIRSKQGAHNALIGVEELTQKDLDTFTRLYKTISKRADTTMPTGSEDTGTPDVPRS